MLKGLTDGGSWKRGVDYYEQGKVILLFEDKGKITAKVRGYRTYKVKLWEEDGQLDGSCSCPMGDEGVFCKHCVAAGLTYIAGGVKPVDEDSRSFRRQKNPRPPIAVEDVRKYLSKQKTDALVEIIMDQVSDNDALREKLMMKAARFEKKEPDIAVFKEMIYKATDTRSFVDYESTYSFAKRINNAVDVVEELLADGFAKETVELAEYALKRVENVLGETDDSNGQIGDILERLERIHHKACLKAKPEPEVLAKRLFEWELTTEWDTFFGAVKTYSDVLGKRGLDVYRKLAEAEWLKVPSLERGEAEKSYYGRRSRINSIMESVAKADGDIEALIAIKSKDLSSAYCFLEIAQAYKDYGQHDKALEWAENGLKTFPDKTDSRLITFLADEYHRIKQHDKAMQIIWDNFAERPDIENYQNLKKHADRINEWPKWRQKALEYIKAAIAGKETDRRQADDYWGFKPHNSTLVEIFLWEKDIEAAWYEAQKGGCSDWLWMQLAKLQEKNHPEKAVEVYKKQVNPIVEQTNSSSYREAVTLIRKIHRLMKKIGSEKRFDEYKSSLMTKYKPKRNFVTMLKRVR